MDRDTALDTYRYLRGGIPVMLVLLAAALIIERAGATCWQTSISAYYFTSAHAVFIGAICAIGTLLIVYKGSRDTEDILLNLAGAAIFCGKALAIVFVQMWLRWTLPRPRIDQVLYTCVKVLFPAACVLLVGAAIWQMLVPSWQGGSLIENPLPWVHYNPLSWADWSRGGATTALIVQSLLALVGVSLAGAMALWVAYAFVTGRTRRQRLSEPHPIPEPA